MALNLIWVTFFLAAAVVAIIKIIFDADMHIFKTIIDGVFESAKAGVEISFGRRRWRRKPERLPN